MYEKLKLIKNLVDYLVVENKCENKILNRINEENLDFIDINSHIDYRKFLTFFHRLQ